MVRNRAASLGRPSARPAASCGLGPVIVPVPSAAIGAGHPAARCCGAGRCHPAAAPIGGGRRRGVAHRCHVHAGDGAHGCRPLCPCSTPMPVPHVHPRGRCPAPCPSSWSIPVVPAILCPAAAHRCPRDRRPGAGCLQSLPACVCEGREEGGPIGPPKKVTPRVRVRGAMESKDQLDP